LIDLTTIRH